MADLRKYGESQTYTFDLFQVDGVDFEPAATFAEGDIKIMKDEGAEANTTNLPTDEGQGYSIVLTATEMEAARVKVYIVDQTATKIWLDTSLTIETYGNASAQHAFDLDTASTPQTADHTAGIADIPTVAEFNARTLAAAAYFDPAADAVANVTLVATTTTNSDMRGTDSALLAASYTAPDNAGISQNNTDINVNTSGIAAILSELGTAGDGLTNINLPDQTMNITGSITGNLSGSVGSVTAAVTADNMRGTDDALPAASYTAPDNTGIADNGAAIAALNNFDPTAQMTESYAANGVAPTFTQAQFAMHQMIMQFGISGTSYTVRQLDDTTPAFVVTLNDAVNPTDAKRV